MQELDHSQVGLTSIFMTIRPWASYYAFLRFSTLPGGKNRIEMEILLCEQFF
jgi:hypothetical protein